MTSTDGIILISTIITIIIHIGAQASTVGMTLGHIAGMTHGIIHTTGDITDGDGHTMAGIIRIIIGIIPIMAAAGMPTVVIQARQTMMETDVYSVADKAEAHTDTAVATSPVREALLRLVEAHAAATVVQQVVHAQEAR